MEKQQVIKNIIFLPRQFYTEGRSSIYLLLKESGYFQMYDKIQVDDIFKVLKEYPESIEDWLELSENKRTDSGWYFKQNAVGKYMVGYFPPKDFQLIEYTDIMAACATFIKQEIEDIRKS